MEPAQSLTRMRSDREKLYASVRGKIREKTQRETKRQMYHYEGTARIKDGDSGDDFENGFAL